MSNIKLLKWMFKPIINYRKYSMSYGMCSEWKDGRQYVDISTMYSVWAKFSNLVWFSPNKCIKLSALTWDPLLFSSLIKRKFWQTWVKPVNPIYQDNSMFVFFLLCWVFMMLVKSQFLGFILYLMFCSLSCRNFRCSHTQKNVSGLLNILGSQH